MSFRRLAGIAGVLAALSVIATIVIQGSFPAIDDPVSDVADYFRDESDSLRISAITNQLTGLFIAVFAAGVIAALRDAERGTGRAWAVVALIGIVTTYAAFDTSSSHQGALLLNADELSGDGVTRSVFDSSVIAFAAGSFNTALFLLGIGAGILTTRFLPVWLGWLALVGAALGVLSAFGFGDRDSMAGLGMLGLGGQMALLLFAVIGGILMARDTTPASQA